jgi:hypothetical protein
VQVLRTNRIEPHFLFKISDSMAWLHSVGLIKDEYYGILVKYIQEENQLAKAQLNPPQ